MEQLQRAGINSDLNERRDKALFYLKNTGEYDPAVREWENKTAATKTWANIKTFISSEYAKENKQTKATAKQFKANLIEESAEATKELMGLDTIFTTWKGKAPITVREAARAMSMMGGQGMRNADGKNNTADARRGRAGQNSVSAL